MKYIIVQSEINTIQKILNKNLKARDIKLDTKLFFDKSYYGRNCFKTSDTSRKFSAIDVTDEELWVLDQWKPIPFFERQMISCIDGTVVYYHKFINNEQTINSIYLPNSDEFIKEKLNNKIPFADLHLMIPCSFDSPKNFGKSMFNEIANFLIYNVEKSNREEFSNDFVKTLNREYLGSFIINVEEVYQPCFITIAKHNKTSLCVIDIVIMNLASDGHKLMGHFRNGSLRIGKRNEFILLSDWLCQIGLKVTGECRSIIFSSKALDKTSIINIMAAEYCPMGEITGKDFELCAGDNIAQYDTAKVFVSEIALLEINNKFVHDVRTRLESQAIEIFFVELIMLQDAAISVVSDKIYKGLNHPIDYANNTFENLMGLVREMSSTSMFFEPRNFKFPTVRISAQKIARKFGLYRQKTIYSENKAILEQLIQLYHAQQESKENQIINIILVVLTIVQVIPIISSGIHYFIFGTINAAEVISEIASWGILIIIFILLYKRKRDINRRLNERL